MFWTDLRTGVKVNSVSGMKMTDELFGKSDAEVVKSHSKWHVILAQAVEKAKGNLTSSVYAYLLTESNSVWVRN